MMRLAGLAGGRRGVLVGGGGASPEARRAPAAAWGALAALGLAALAIWRLWS